MNNNNIIIIIIFILIIIVIVIILIYNNNNYYYYFNIRDGYIYHLSRKKCICEIVIDTVIAIFIIYTILNVI